MHSFSFRNPALGPRFFRNGGVGRGERPAVAENRGVGRGERPSVTENRAVGRGRKQPPSENMGSSRGFKQIMAEEKREERKDMTFGRRMPAAESKAWNDSKYYNYF